MNRADVRLVVAFQECSGDVLFYLIIGGKSARSLLNRFSTKLIILKSFGHILINERNINILMRSLLIYKAAGDIIKIN